MTQREERIQDDRIRVTPEIVNKEAIKTRYETRQSHKSSSRARLSQTLPHFVPQGSLAGVPPLGSTWLGHQTDPNRLSGRWAGTPTPCSSQTSLFIISATGWASSSTLLKVCTLLS
jgi:hypothetical protein